MSDVGSWGHIKKSECQHISALYENIKSDATSCENCSHKEDLRICLTCGKVFCCESYKAHNTEHFKKTGHPFIRPYMCDYNWLWCYKCNAFLE